jgi:hypothetical protein
MVRACSRSVNSLGHRCRCLWQAGHGRMRASTTRKPRRARHQPGLKRGAKVGQALFCEGGAEGDRGDGSRGLLPAGGEPLDATKRGRGAAVESALVERGRDYARIDYAFRHQSPGAGYKTRVGVPPRWRLRPVSGYGLDSRLRCAAAYLKSRGNPGC